MARRSPRQVLPYVQLLAKVLGPRVRLLHILTGSECAAMIRSGHVPPRTAHGIRTTYRERKQYAWELLHEQDEIYLATQAGIQAESDVGVDGRTETWSSVRMLYPSRLSRRPRMAMVACDAGRSAAPPTKRSRLRVPVFLVRSRADATAGAPTFKRILVPLDGLDLAATALAPAIELARSAGAELILLRAVEQQPQYVSLLIMRRNQATAALDALVADIRRQALVTPVVTADYGNSAKAIIEEAARRQADMIVMATHGYGGVRRWMLGIVVDKVLQAAPTPLLLVRPPTDVTVGVLDARCAVST